MSLFPIDWEFRDNRDFDPRIFLGCAGWSYDDWDGPFYPRSTSAPGRLPYYASQFRSVEIDSTFYGVPSVSTVKNWYERTPDDFVFAAKFPRAITHDKRLIQVDFEVQHFIETMSYLGEKLGPLLLQFPPSFSASGFEDLERVLGSLPDDKMFAVEVRNSSWLTDEFAELLKEHKVALCLACEGPIARFWRVTARFAYIRWLGDHDAFDTFGEVRVDRNDDFDWWVPRIRHLTEQDGLVFGYVNNHYAGYSPACVELIEKKLIEHQS